MAEKTNVVVKQNGGTLRRWDPFEMLDELQEEMARFWGDTWPLTARWFPRRLTTTAWTPRVDVYAKDANLIVKAELPGLKPEDVQITIEDGQLVIQGERKTESEVKEENYYRMERSYGNFYRRLPLPRDVKAEQIEATFADGILEIHIPKPVEKKPEPKKIPIATK